MEEVNIEKLILVRGFGVLMWVVFDLSGHIGILWECTQETPKKLYFAYL